MCSSNEKSNHDQHHNTYYKGSSKLKIWEAMAATSAAPFVFDPIQVNIDDGIKTLVDGGLFSNCPVPIALEEAQSLWPNRPIGVVLSLGLDPSQDAFAQDAVDAVRLNHPGLYYQRLIMPEIANFGFLETSPKKLVEMEEMVKGYMSSPRIRAKVSHLLDMLFDGPSRQCPHDPRTGLEKEEVSNVTVTSTSYLRSSNEHTNNSKGVNANEVWVDNCVDNCVGDDIDERTIFSSFLSCCSCLVRLLSPMRTRRTRRRDINDKNKTCNSENQPYRRGNKI